MSINLLLKFICRILRPALCQDKQYAMHIFIFIGMGKLASGRIFYILLFIT
jgi:hypothetical protein